MAPLKWSAARLAAASVEIRKILDHPSVDAAAGRLRDIMLAPTGLEKQIADDAFG